MLNESSDSKFLTRKWNIVNDQSNANCDVGNKIIFSPFINCITKTDGTTTDDTEDLDLVIPMYNKLEYSSNYSETTDSLWFYSKDEATNLMLILGMILLSNVSIIRLDY